MHDGLPMWTYWSLQEGTLGVDPGLQKTNDGRMPPVIHVDTDAPLYSDVDGSLITDKLWGIYYKPDFHFGGVQGGAMPYKVQTPADQVAVDPYGPDSPDFIVGDDFATCGARRWRTARSGSRARSPSTRRSRRAASAASRPTTSRSSTASARTSTSSPTATTATRWSAWASWSPRSCRRDQPTAGAVPLLALRRGQAAPGLEQPVPLELSRPGPKPARRMEMAKLPVEEYVERQRAGQAGQGGPQEDRRAGHHLHLLPVHLGHRPHRRQGDPRRSLGAHRRAGFQLVYGSTANLFIDRHGQYIGYGPEASELIGIPDPETFASCPGTSGWRACSASASAIARRTRSRAASSPPTAAATSPHHDEFREKHEHAAAHGLRARDDVAEEGRGRQARRRASKPYCYHIDQFESLRPVSMRVIDYARAMGLDMIQGDHEDAPGQLELNFTYDDALRTADRLTTYRQICAQVAREFGLIACFMSKPFMGVSANGCHTNISLWSGGEDRVNPLSRRTCRGWRARSPTSNGGENHFMPDGAVHPKKPGPVGLHCVGGVMEHLPALTAIGCSTVNSYRRLWDQGFWAPVYADWGYQNRTCGLRISAPGRFEYRAVDSMVNPYLLASGLLMAFDDGLTRKLDPGEPESRNIYQAMKEGKDVKKLPMTLGEALDRLDDDEVIKHRHVGRDVPRVHPHYKGAEAQIPISKRRHRHCREARAVSIGP